MFNNKIIFITWWTWTWWTSLVKALLSDFSVKKIIIFSRSENPQVQMEKNFHSDKLLFVLWDVRDKELLQEVTIWVDYIIHLAALKHIYKCNQNPKEATSINVTGTQNIIDIAIHNNVKKVLYVSTDKAVDPYNLYGRTKACWEELIINANNEMNNKWTVFFIVRAGNILWSNGSVLHIFYNQLKNNQAITVTDFQMRRFYIPIEEVIELIFYAFMNAKWWENYICKWDVLSVQELYNILLQLYWNGHNKVEEVWIYDWEKQDEVLISSNEVHNTYILNDKYFLIDSLWKYTGGLKKVDFDIYSTENACEKNNKTSDKIQQYIITLLWKK